MQIDRDLLGRLAALQHAAFPKRLAVAQHLEHDTALLADFVIDADGGGETLAFAVERNAQGAVGVRAEPVLEAFPIDKQRVIVHRSIGVGFAPPLLGVFQVQGFDAESVRQRTCRQKTTQRQGGDESGFFHKLKRLRLKVLKG